MLEKEIDNFIAETLQKNKIDFLRIRNNSFRNAKGNYKTTAYDKEFPCDKYFPDFIFPFRARVFLIENGLKVSNQLKHKKRKSLQKERIINWMINGGCQGYIVSSLISAKAVFKTIGVDYD